MRKTLVLSLVLFACGDNSRICGEGTTENEKGECVSGGAASCAAGTMEVDGQCVPDGTVVCAQGTVFDPATGTCMLDPSACAEGTVLVEGTCVPDDEGLPGMADHTEAAEPNGPGDTNEAGSFDAPALDASTTFYGCVTATEDADMDGNLDEDLDAWYVTASEPMVLEVTADGIGGLSAGFVAINATASNSPDLDNWQRIGINLTGDTAKRQIYLPKAGVYALVLTDSRSLFLGSAGAGSPDTCYFTTVKRVALPAATTATLPTTTGMHTGDVQVFTVAATANGDIVDVTQNSSAPAFSPAFVTLKQTAFHRSAAPVPGPFGDSPPFDTVGGLDSGNTVTVIVDPEYNYGLSPQEYTLDFFKIGGTALPINGTMLTLTEKNGTTPAGYPDLNYSYFDVATAGLKRFDVTSTKPVDMAIVSSDVRDATTGRLDFVANIDAIGGSGRAAFQNEVVKFLTPGRYYFVTQNPAATMAGGMYTLTSTVTDVASPALTFGTASNNIPLAGSEGFHTLDLTDPVWIEIGVTGTTNWGTGNVAINAYDSAAEGWLRAGTPPSNPPTGQIYPAFGGTQPAAAPFAALGRILAGDPRDYLLRVTPTAAPGANATYSLLAQNRPNVVAVGMVTPGTPIMRTITALTNGAPARFVAFGASGNTIRSLANPAATADLREVRLDASETPLATFDATLVGGDETLVATVSANPPANWVAWTVENKTPTVPTDVDVTITATAPRPYTITSGTLAFTDICTAATELGTGLDDEVFANQTLPATFTAFQLFGEQVPSNHRVGANGWLSWDTGTVSVGGFRNQPIPTAGAPNGLLAPYWQDQDTITLCRLDTATTVTYQWTGTIFQTSINVQYQLVLHSTGVIDYIYGPNHDGDCSFDDGDGTGCTVGAENLAGTFGHQIVFDTAGVAPSTSRTLTPM